jgi:uncharacterized protein (DUF1684 family)
MSFAAADTDYMQRIEKTINSKPISAQTMLAIDKLAGNSWFPIDPVYGVVANDETIGRTTYGGGRFLHAMLPKNGSTVLDFNQAFNPYCSGDSSEPR